MTTLKTTRIRLFALLCLTVFTLAAGDVVYGDVLTRIDRSSSRESGELDRDCQQRIAQITGFGDFLVRTVKIPCDGSPLGRACVFYVYASADALQNGVPLKRIFFSYDKAENKIVGGDDEELVDRFLQQLSAKAVDEKTVGRLLPEILLAALYANRAELLHADFQLHADSGQAKGFVSDSAKRAELRTFCLGPGLSRDADGRIVWRGRFVLYCGSVEEVVATVSPNREHAVNLKRREVAPCNYFRNSVDEIVDAEEWVVSNESTWRPSKRLSFTLTLASLGNTKAKYQLGLALMEEHDESAKAEGIKWLRAAAADGYRDAVASLAIFDADSRSLRDRESVRKDSCCRLPR